MKERKKQERLTEQRNKYSTEEGKEANEQKKKKKAKEKERIKKEITE